MKLQKIFLIILLLPVVIHLQGCYTQLATTEEDEEYTYGETESSSPGRQEYYDPYDYPPPYTYWGFRFYYPSWYSFWYYERWYPYTHIWHDPWYSPWFGTTIIVHPAPYWWYHRHIYHDGYLWGWHSRYRGYSRIYSSEMSPREWGTTRGEEKGYRDFGGTRGTLGSPSGSVTLPPSGSATSTETINNSTLRRHSSESRETTRRFSTGRVARTPRQADIVPQQRSEDREAINRRELQPGSGERRAESSESRSYRRSSDSSYPSVPRSSSERSSERSVERGSPQHTQPSSPPPARDYSGGRSSGSEARGSGRSR
ncbi:MAG: hypothetical protein N3A63_08625 [Bacteroidetes bacterium]|nr:hypothetical protein [Bacteroidota bacterium]